VSLQEHHKFILDAMDRQNAIARNFVAELEAENAQLKAECQARQVENSVLAVECDSLKSEVERLRFAEDLLKDENKHFREEEPLPDGWNSSVAKACDLIAEKDKEIARLKAEVERLTKAGDALHCFLIGYIVENRLSSSYLNKLDDDWNKALNKNLP